MSRLKIKVGLCRAGKLVDVPWKCLRCCGLGQAQRRRGRNLARAEGRHRGHDHQHRLCTAVPHQRGSQEHLHLREGRHFHMQRKIVLKFYSSPKRSSLKGDSGGPLFGVGPSGERTLVGLVSWGNGCAVWIATGIITLASQNLHSRSLAFSIRKRVATH